MFGWFGLQMDVRIGYEPMSQCSRLPVPDTP